MSTEYKFDDEGFLIPEAGQVWTHITTGLKATLVSPSGPNQWHSKMPINDKIQDVMIDISEETALYHFNLDDQ